MTNRIYAACLASFNNRVLHGAWIDASTDTDEMQTAIDAMLRTSKFPNVTVDCPACEVGRRGYAHANAVTGYHMGRPVIGPVKFHYPCDACNGTGKVPSAEEWAIHAHEGPWLKDVGEFAGLAEVARRMAIAEAMDGEGFDDDEAPELFAAYVDHHGAHYIKNDEPDEIAERIREAYHGTARNREEWAEQFADDTGLLNKVPENLRHYFDFDAFARDMELNGEVDFVSGGDGVYVFMWN